MNQLEFNKKVSGTANNNFQPICTNVRTIGQLIAYLQEIAKFTGDNAPVIPVFGCEDDIYETEVRVALAKNELPEDLAKNSEYVVTIN